MMIADLRDMIESWAGEMMGSFDSKIDGPQKQTKIR